MTIGKRMLLLGVVMFISISALSLNGYYQSMVLVSANDQLVGRTYEGNKIAVLKAAYFELMQVVMASMADRASGGSAAEQLRQIKELSEFLTSSVNDLLASASSPEQKKLAGRVKEGFHKTHPRPERRIREIEKRLENYSGMTHVDDAVADRRYQAALGDI